MACAAEKGKSLKIVCMARLIVPPEGGGSQGGGAHPGGHQRLPARTVWKPFPRNPLQTFESPAPRFQISDRRGMNRGNPVTSRSIRGTSRDGLRGSDAAPPSRRSI